MLSDRILMSDFGNKCDDTTGSAGECNLIAGDMDMGYFGLVPSSSLWNATEILNQFGFSTTNILFNADGWFKFAYNGKILFIRKRPISSFSNFHVNMHTLNEKNLIYGSSDSIMEKEGVKYILRLPTGLSRSPNIVAPFYPDDAIGSEMNLFNNLMNGNWDVLSPSSLRYEGSNNSGAITVTQNYGTTNSSYISRWATSGDIDANKVAQIGYTESNYKYGWRPLLEVIK